VLVLVRQLTKKYTLKQQSKMLRSNYKAFKATIVLKSYCSKLIDLFKGAALFNWLMSNAEKRNLVPCGSDGLCFKREILVRGTKSLCFLVYDKAVTDKMELVILCRTQGRDVHEYVFREGSNVGISIVDSIAVESAGLSYGELQAAARNLRRDDLWTRLSKTGPFASSNDQAAQPLINEFLELCTVWPIAQHLKNTMEFRRLVGLFEELDTDWRLVCELMSKDPAFSPSWTFTSEELQLRKGLFYMRNEELFLCMKIPIDSDGRDIEFEIVERNGCSSAEKKSMVIQKLVNFLLYFIWSDML
jgi:hypothetical protein